MPDDFLTEYFLFICVVSSCLLHVFGRKPMQNRMYSVDPTARNRNLIFTTRLKQTKQFQLSAFPVSYFSLSVCLKIKENLEIFSLRFDRLKVLFSSVLYITSKEATYPCKSPEMEKEDFCQELEKIYSHSILSRRQHHSTFYIKLKLL